jgi:hypothetical protein
LLLVSCVDLEKSTQLKQLEQLGNKIDSIKIVLIELRSDAFRNETNQNTKKLNEVLDYLASDTLMESEARLIDDYLKTTQKMQLLLKNMDVMNNQLNEEKTRIRKLVKDISNRFEQNQCSLAETTIAEYRSKRDLLTTKAAKLNDEIFILKENYMTKKLEQ